MQLPDFKEAVLFVAVVPESTSLSQKLNNLAISNKELCSEFEVLRSILQVGRVEVREQQKQDVILALNPCQPSLFHITQIKIIMITIIIMMIIIIIIQM